MRVRRTLKRQQINLIGFKAVLTEGDRKVTVTIFSKAASKDYYWVRANRSGQEWFTHVSNLRLV